MVLRSPGGLATPFPWVLAFPLPYPFPWGVRVLPMACVNCVTVASPTEIVRPRTIPSHAPSSEPPSTTSRHQPKMKDRGFSEKLPRNFKREGGKNVVPFGKVGCTCLFERGATRQRQQLSKQGKLAHLPLGDGGQRNGRTLPHTRRR